MTEEKFWRTGYGIAVVAMIFLLVGLSLLYSGFDGLLFNLSVSTWKKVDAKVVSVKTLPIYAKGQEVIGYYLTAEYLYSINGKKYQGSKVSPDPTFGHDQVCLVEKRELLEKLRDTSEPLKVFVNPKNLSQSFLFVNRPIQPYIYLLFSALFISLAFIFLLIFIQKKQLEDERTQRKKQHPGQPWRWEACWQRFEQSTPPSINKLLPIWGMTIFLGLISIASAIIAGWDGEATSMLYFAVAILFLAWLSSVNFLVARVKGINKIVGVKFIANSYPLILGEPWSGRIIIPKNDKIDIDELVLRFAQEQYFVNGFEVKLSVASKANHAYERLEELEGVGICELTDAQRNNRAMSEAQDFSISFETLSDKDNIILDVSIITPEQSEETDLETEQAIRWVLALTTTEVNSQLYERFFVPVYKRGSFSEPQT